MKGKIIFGVVLVAAVILISIFVLVLGNQPIKVGFIGTLTGKTSTHDISVRNGVILKMEQVNSSGGISGKNIELIFEDSKSDTNEAKKAIENLINEDVLVVLGPPTSGVAADIIDIVNEEDILLIAPTVASNYFNSLDDNMIRIVTPTNQMGKIIAEYLVENESYENILAFYDTSNEAYCLDVINVFDEFFSNENRKVIEAIPFNTNDVDFQKLAEESVIYSPDAILFVSSAYDLAEFAQIMQNEELEIPLISSSWAKQDELIENGGNAVEDIVLGSVFDENNNSEKYQKFNEDYFNRFNVYPDFGAAYGYEIASILIDTLNEYPKISRQNIKENILKIKGFEGLYDEIVFDEFGDVNRQLYIVTIKDGEFVKIY